MVRNDIPSHIVEKIRKYLSELNYSREGKAILSEMETARFIIASNKDYNVVRNYVNRFEKNVRRIQTK